MKVLASTSNKEKAILGAFSGHYEIREGSLTALMHHPRNVGGGLTDVSTNVCGPGRRSEKWGDVCLEILNLIYS